MSEQTVDQHFEAWYSTYGHMTIGRLLEYFSIQLPKEKIMPLLNDAHKMFRRVMNIPLLSVFNGIIFQQAYDYQVYVQKLMINYRLSPEYAKSPEAPGENIRQVLSQQYDQLLACVNAFSEHQYQHYQFISDSQAYLIGYFESFSNPLDDLEKLSNDPDFCEQLKTFEEQAKEITLIFRSDRRQFYDLILAISDQLAGLTDYKFNVEEAKKERQALFFDNKIGETPPFTD